MILNLPLAFHLPDCDALNAIKTYKVIHAHAKQDFVDISLADGREALHSFWSGEALITVDNY